MRAKTSIQLTTYKPMIKKSTLIKFSSAALASFFIASCDGGSDSDSDGELQTIRTNVTLEASGPLGLSGGFFVAHNGDFDLFDADSAASDAITILAEEGSNSGLSAVVNSDNNGDSLRFFY